MIFRKLDNLDQNPFNVMENESIPGVYVVDGLIKNDLLVEKYAWFLREVNWRFIINSGWNQVVTFPPHDMPDAQGDNKMWGFSLYDETTEPPYSITSKGNSYGDASAYDWLFELTSFVTQQLFDCPFDLYGAHMNGQTKLLNARVHADTGYNIILFLTPNWKPEWGGELRIYEEQEDEKPAASVPYVSGRVVFFHARNGHEAGLKFKPRWINKDKIIWHQGFGPTEKCNELRISMNLRGKVCYEGAKVDMSDAREPYAVGHRSIIENNKNLLEYSQEK